MLLLLGAMVFIGYSVGKPIIDFIGERTPGKEDKSAYATLPTEDTEKISESTDVSTDTQPADTHSEAQTTAPQPIEDELSAMQKGVLFITYPGETVGSYEEYVLERIEYAKENHYCGICVELLAEGGRVLFKTENELAAAAQAVAPNCIVNLNGVVTAAQDAGMKVYGEISALSDHLASWYDKSVSYMIEGSISRWLDNGIESGGKPWISPFEQRSKDYIGGICGEISSAGFAGLLAKNLEFPEFRQRDLEYIGSRVKTADRYKALVGFAESIYNSFGTAKEFGAEVNIEDIVSKKAEVISHPAELCTKSIYVRFDPSKTPMRIKRADGSEISLEGLDNANMLKVLLRHTAQNLEGSGFTVFPIICGCEKDEGVMTVLKEAGFDISQVIFMDGDPEKPVSFNGAL